MLDFNPWNSVLLMQGLKYRDERRPMSEREQALAASEEQSSCGLCSAAGRVAARLKSLFAGGAQRSAKLNVPPQTVTPAVANDLGLPVRKRQPGRRPAKPLVSAEEYRAVASRDAATRDSARERVTRD